MSSDQILWDFSRLRNRIYSVKLIFLKLKVQLYIYCYVHIYCNYFVNSPAYVVETSPVRLVLFHLLNTFLPDIKSLQTHCY